MRTLALFTSLLFLTAAAEASAFDVVGVVGALGGGEPVDGQSADRRAVTRRGGFDLNRIVALEPEFLNPAHGDVGHVHDEHCGHDHSHGHKHDHKS